MTYQYPRGLNPAVSEPLNFGEEDHTTQSNRDESDVNYIVNRYQRTGDLPPNPRGLEPQYLDASAFAGDPTELHSKSLRDIEEITDQINEAKAAHESQERDNSDPPPPPSPTQKTQPTGEKGASQTPKVEVPD